WDNLSIDTSTDVDWFQFSTVGTGGSAHFVSIDFSNAAGDVDLYLYDSRDNLLLSSATANDGERVPLTRLPAGVYYVKVVGGFPGAIQPAYRLRISAPTGATSVPDRFEGTTGNDTPASATPVTDPGAPTLSGVQTLDNLTLHSSSDQDWF